MNENIELYHLIKNKEREITSLNQSINFTLKKTETRILNTNRAK